MAKGGQFERDLCHVLNRWWTGEKDPDIMFWRTAQSGGMATTRRKKGLKASVHASDICSMHPSSKPFTDVVSLEAKRGIAGCRTGDLLGKAKSTPQTPIEAFIQQARTAAVNAGSLSWMLVHQANKRIPVAYFPHVLMKALVNAGAFLYPPTPFATIDSVLRERHVVKGKNVTKFRRELIVAMSFPKFLKNVTPDHIRHLAWTGLL